jgi:hypothetical protein
VYSLVNIATLVRDLARHPRAERVATELLRAFALGPAELEALDRVRYDADAQARRRAAVLEADAARPRALHVLAAARGFADDLGIDAYVAAVDVLEQASIGDLEALARFVRDDVLTEAWAVDTDVADLVVARRPVALDVVVDGVLGTFAGDDELAAPWLRWAADHGIAPEATAWPHVIRAAGQLRPGVVVAPAPAEWAARMHDACWAVHLTGRERAAAVTQLHALRVLARAWAPAPPPLRVVSMTAAAVHGTVVADVLDGATATAMSQPLFSVSSGAMP